MKFKKSTVKAELPLIVRVYCRKCGYREHSETPPHSFRCNCPDCGERLGSSRNPDLPPAFSSRCDTDPHQYSITSTDKSYQVYFSTPGFKNGHCGFSFGDEDPADCCDISDPFEAIEYCIEKAKGYIYYGGIDRIKDLESYMLENETEIRRNIAINAAYKYAVNARKCINDYESALAEYDGLSEDKEPAQ